MTTRSPSPSESAAAAAEVSRRLQKLSGWVATPLPGDLQSVVRECAERLHGIFGAERTLFCWEELDEPWLNLTDCSEGLVHVREEPPDRYGSLVAPELDGCTFEIEGGSPEVRVDTGEVLRLAVPVNPALPHVAGRPLLSFAVETQAITGRIFLIDLPLEPPTDFAVAGVAAAVIALRIEQAGTIEQARPEAATEARERIARDLHDGVLQSFTGAVLQLEAAHRMVESGEHDGARKVITDVEATLMSEQRTLRRYIEQLRPRTRDAEGKFDFAEQLRELTERYRRQWGIEVDVTIGVMPEVLYRSLGWETYRLVSEGVTNAARHAEATRVDVSIGAAGGKLLVAVSDDGCGFPFRGKLTMDELSARHLGPVSLRERIRALNGEFTIESSDSGSRIEIGLPVGWKGE
jgi:signal transduction histidine kinase